MKDGFIKVGATCTEVHVANPVANQVFILDQMRNAHEQGVNLLVFPELCITGYSCGDLFYTEGLTEAALAVLKTLTEASAELAPVYVVGLPLRYGYKLFNVAAVLHRGKLLGIVPKTYLANHSGFCESRWFVSGADLFSENVALSLFGQEVPFGTNLLFAHDELTNFRFGVELCSDLEAVIPPSTDLCSAGALIIVNPSASAEYVDMSAYRRKLVTATSQRLICGYVYACADSSESTTNMVFAAHHLIAENGILLCENPPFGDMSLLVSEIDVNRLAAERMRNSFYTMNPYDDYNVIAFHEPIAPTVLTRPIEPNPFVPVDETELRERIETVLQVQTKALKKRLTHTHSKTAILGISGGLDSALALLVVIRVLDELAKPRTDLVAVTMPCFGTTGRTKGNAVTLCEALGVTLREIDIKESVSLHMRDIGHDPEIHNTTYENAQARMRTQILMNMANDLNGLVVGTGDLSELALGWATYNGDHMSMYGVNASVPKTLVRAIVRYEAERIGGTAGQVLLDIVDTPVSPELLPTDKDGNMTQMTEDVVGPYELHDFFLYYYTRLGFTPAKIFRLAKYAFGDEYDAATIEKWLRTFLRRFTTQQFKRSCMPDGPKVGSVSLSPRGDWNMPSDAEPMEFEL